MFFHKCLFDLLFKVLKKTALFRLLDLILLFVFQFVILL